jgi:dTDP-glucose pyrophosphorylase
MLECWKDVMQIINDLDPHVCGLDMPIREVLGRIDRSHYLFQVVIDRDGRLQGTVTDGDVRRAMLHGVGLDAPIRECMQTKPVVGRIGEAEGNFAKVHRTGSSRAFLPIVDEAGVLREIYVEQGRPDSGIRTALIMAGGAGTRLGERTRYTPKPLLPVGGRPILDHVLERLEESGVGTIVVSVHHLADKIEEFLKTRSSRAAIQVVREPSRLGTAGAIGRLGPAITVSPILVVNGDVLTQVDYSAMHEFHVRHGHDATVGVARYDVDIPFGVVRYGEDGSFAGIEEKPRITNFIAAGVYYLSPQFAGLVSQDRPIDMPELLNIGRDIGLRIGLFPIHEYWTDIGRPADLDRADDWHRSRSLAK